MLEQDQSRFLETIDFDVPARAMLKMQRLVLILMKTRWSISTLKRGRLVKAVALLFLFHTGVDLLLPQLCSEEPVNLTATQTLIASSRTVSDKVVNSVNPSNPSDSQEDEPSETPQDEDCFCCCTHVMASQGFGNPASAELGLATNLRLDLSILSAPPNNPYHPPRFA